VVVLESYGGLRGADAAGVVREPQPAEPGGGAGGGRDGRAGADVAARAGMAGLEVTGPAYGISGTQVPPEQNSPGQSASVTHSSLTGSKSMPPV